MTFQSLLSADAATSPANNVQEPPFFHDLNLDFVVEQVVSGREQYRLKPLFYTAAATIDQVYYRQAIMKDVEKPGVLEPIRAFARAMDIMRGHLAKSGQTYYRPQKQAWFLEAVRVYSQAVEALVSDLLGADIQSPGLRRFIEYALAYEGAEDFRDLVRTTKQLQSDLTAIQYDLHIKGGTVTVKPSGTESDYRQEVEDSFSRFRREGQRGPSSLAGASSDLNHVEAMILDRVVRLNPIPFGQLDAYCDRYLTHYLDPAIAQFDREIQFYLAFGDFMTRISGPGLSFCYPALSEQTRDIRADDAFDVALAAKLAQDRKTPVTNSFDLREPERIFVVTGPNQGGKTTFARMLGQLHYLAKLGLPVPGHDAHLSFIDNFLTHFERQEAADLSGTLANDLLRMRGILDQATDRSLIILNEIFSSTTLRDAQYLGAKIIEAIIERGSWAVIVTFIAEWADLSPAIVSWVCGVHPDDPSVRTYRIGRRSPDERAYSHSIAEKYNLTYERLKERVH